MTTTKPIEQLASELAWELCEYDHDRDKKSYITGYLAGAAEMKRRAESLKHAHYKLESAIIKLNGWEPTNEQFIAAIKLLNDHKIGADKALAQWNETTGGEK